MAREIKVRAWDAHEEVMSKSFGINDGATRDADILMQYTGLKDKNDKEIYEGDFVAMCWHDKKEKHNECPSVLEPYLVEWKLDRFILSPLRDATIHTKEQSFMSIFGKENTTKEQIEVVGNIYENPEKLST